MQSRQHLCSLTYLRTKSFWVPPLQSRLGCQVVLAVALWGEEGWRAGSDQLNRSCLQLSQDRANLWWGMGQPCLLLPAASVCSQLTYTEDLISARVTWGLQTPSPWTTEGSVESKSKFPSQSQIHLRALDTVTRKGTGVWTFRDGWKQLFIHSCLAWCFAISIQTVPFSALVRQVSGRGVDVPLLHAPSTCHQKKAVPLAEGLNRTRVKVQSGFSSWVWKMSLTLHFYFQWCACSFHSPRHLVSALSNVIPCTSTEFLCYLI